MREAGWSAVWGGRNMPAAEIVHRVEQGGVGLVGLSASSSSSDAKALAKEVERVAPACERVGAHLVLGGRGAWPENVTRRACVHRIERFSDLHELDRK